jgi:hypothetical protein
MTGYDKSKILSGPVLSVWAKVEAVIIACGKMDVGVEFCSTIFET